MLAYKVVDNILFGHETPLYNSGQMFRDRTYVDDIVRGIVAAIYRPLGYEVINLGRGEPFLLRTFIQEIENLVGRPAHLTPTPSMRFGIRTAHDGTARPAFTMASVTSRLQMAVARRPLADGVGISIGNLHISKRNRLYVLAGYILVVAAVFLYFNIPLLVEWVALILFVGAVIAGRADIFFRDWGAFLAALLAWQFTAPVATQLATPWHLTELISADRFLFHGVVPAVWLQAHLFHPGVLEPWDVLAVVMYSLHFFTPLIVGFVLWLTNRDLFHKFAFAFVLVAVAGFATYIVYPAVPPWLAAQPLVPYGHIYLRSPSGHVYLPGVRNVFDAAAYHWYNAYNGQISIGFLHQHVDQIGAMPSQHAAFPFLCLLFLRRQFGRWAHLGWLYIIGITFSIVYLGQHYVIDALVGFVYAAVGYVFVMYAMPRLQIFLAERFPDGVHLGMARAGSPPHGIAADDERPRDVASR